MNKRCSLGKSCGATCIHRPDDCLLELPEKVNRVVGSVALEVTEIKEKRMLNYQWTEAAVAAVLSGKKIESKEDLADFLVNSNLANPREYINHLYGGSTGSNPVDKDSYKNYINHLEKVFEPYIGKVEKVAIAGSTRNTPDVIAADKGLTPKQKKADVLFWIDGKPNGVSVKTDNGATLVNYTVGKYDTKGSELRKIREETLAKTGFAKDWKKTVTTTTEKAAARAKMAEPFRDPNHPYWVSLKTQILNDKQSFLKDLLEGYTALGIPYPLYEVSDRTFKDLRKVGADILNPNSKLDIEFKPSTGKAASLKFVVTSSGKPLFDGEIRNKGEWFNPLNIQLYNSDKGTKATVSKEARAELRAEMKGDKLLEQLMGRKLRDTTSPAPTTPRVRAKKEPVARQPVKTEQRKPDLDKQLAGLKKQIEGFRAQGYKDVRIREELRKLRVPAPLISQAL